MYIKKTFFYPLRSLALAGSVTVIWLDLLGMEDPIVPADIFKVQREGLSATAEFVSLAAALVPDGQGCPHSSVGRASGASKRVVVTDFQDALKVQMPPF